MPEIELNSETPGPDGCSELFGLQIGGAISLRARSPRRSTPGSYRGAPRTQGDRMRP